MWIRRSLCFLAICLAQTVFAQAQDYEVQVKNEGVKGYVEVTCAKCDPQEVLARTLMDKGDPAVTATVHGSPPQELDWKHTRADDSRERSGKSEYNTGETVRVLSAN